MWLLRALLRSQGQIFFQRATWSGLLVLLAMAAASAWLAGFAVLGAAVQTSVSLLLRRRARSVARAGAMPAGGSQRASALAMSSLSTDATARRDAADGIYGFCGALTGCAALLACGPSAAALIWTVVGSALCALLVRALERLRIFDWLPMLTGPFCAVNTALHPVFAPWHREVTPGSGTPFSGWWAEYAVGTVRASAQVVLSDHWITGVLLLIIMFVAGRREGLWSLAGAGSATALGICLLGWAPALAGLTGYNGFLTALALGAVFPRRDAAAAVRLLVPLAAACATVPLWWVLQLTEAAVYTWPFVLTTWAVLFAQRAWSRRTVSAPVAP